MIRVGKEEDGGEVGGSWTHLLMHQTGTASWSSENKVNSQQNLSLYEVWKPKIAKDVENRCSYISFHIIVSIPTQHPSLVFIHFTMFLSFVTVVVKYILSHNMPSFYLLLSLYLTV